MYLHRFVQVDYKLYAQLILLFVTPVYYTPTYQLRTCFLKQSFFPYSSCCSRGLTNMTVRRDEGSWPPAAPPEVSMDDNASMGSAAEPVASAASGTTAEGQDCRLIRVRVPELNMEKCLQFQREELIWEVKQQILAALPKVRKNTVCCVVVACTKAQSSIRGGGDLETLHLRLHFHSPTYIEFVALINITTTPTPFLETMFVFENHFFVVPENPWAMLSCGASKNDFSWNGQYQNNWSNCNCPLIECDHITMP